jgi:hypothetical protein
MRVPVQLDHAWRLLNHGPTTLISTAHGERRNVMAAAWVMPIDFTPPKFAAVIAADTWTRELLLASGECVLHAPTTEQAALTNAVGTSSGREGDKFARLRIATEPGAAVRAPLVAGCAAWIECTLLAEPGVQEHLQQIARQAPGFFPADLAEAQRKINGLTLLVACCIGMRDVDVPLPAGTGAFDRVLVDIADFQHANFGIAALGGFQLVP